MTFVTESSDGGKIVQILDKIRRGQAFQMAQMTWNSLGGVYFGFQSFQIGDRYRAAVDLEHSFCL